MFTAIMAAVTAVVYGITAAFNASALVDQNRTAGYMQDKAYNQQRDLYTYELAVTNAQERAAREKNIVYVVLIGLVFIGLVMFLRKK